MTEFSQPTGSEGLNQDGNYSLHLKCSTITLLGHNRVTQCGSGPILLAVFGESRL